MLRVTGLQLALDDELEKLPFLLTKKLGIKRSELLEWQIYKESIDARRKHKITFVYTIDVKVKNEAYIISKKKNAGISYTPDMSYEYVQRGTEKLKNPPVVIGAGPAGLFAGCLLAQMGYRPLVLERGEDVESRTKKVNYFWETGNLDENSNIQFGEGGAGTFSDGKLTTLIKDKRCRKVIEDLVEAGAPPEILYTYKPHVGTDILKNVVKNLRKKIKDLGGEVLFNTRVTDILMENGKIAGVITNDKEKISTQAVILAIGHSARDTFQLLHSRNVAMRAKAFSIGVRIEHSQQLINEAQYKEFAGHPRLGAADYKLVYHAPTGRSLYTFCMCPGGQVVAAASEKGHLVTNGMSKHARDGKNANSALLVGVTPEDFASIGPLAGLDFQRKWEALAFSLGGKDYRAPVQLVEDFLQNKASTCLGTASPTYPRGVVPADLSKCLPPYVVDTMREGIQYFAKKLQGFASPEGILTGVETRSSSPIRILRQDNYEGNISGLYPTGEGAGYAGGIISAAVDGLRVAEAVAQRFQPLKDV